MMSKAIILILMTASLAACGVDGAPTRPAITGFTKVGVASGAGIITDTDINIVFSSN